MEGFVNPQDSISDPAPAPERRWRDDIRLRALARRAPAPFRVPTFGWIAIAAVLLAAGLLLRIGLPARPPRASDGVPIHIVLRDAPAPEPPLPQPAPLPARVGRATEGPLAHRSTPALPPASPSRTTAANEPPALHLYNADGSVVLPQESKPRHDALAATFSGPLLPESMRIMQHQRPLKVRPNHFAQNFRQPSGSALTDFVEDHLTAHREFTLPWGTHVQCTGVGLFVAFVGGCGWYTPYRYYVPTERWKPATELDAQ